MSIKKYETFLKTVDLGSFTKASEVLGYTQSAISHIITGLEDELGVKLLTRGRSGVRLTEEGRSLLPSIRAVCRDNQEVLRQVSELHGLEVGSVRIGTFLSVSVHILPRLIASFSKKHPHIEFELLQGNYEDIEQWLREGRVECGFFRAPTGDGLESIPIIKEKFLAIFPANRVIEDKRFSLEKIKGETYILRPDSMDLSMGSRLRENRSRPKITYSAKDDYAVMAMVEQGLGMSILPELLLKRTPYKLQKKELDPPLYREICLAYKKDQTLPPAARRFLHFVREEYEK